MIATLACLTALASAPEFATPRVVAATAFRNGYGFVLKEIDIPASGEVYVKDLDRPTNGTFWFAPAAGTHVSEVTLTYIVEDSVFSEAGTINDLLLLNVGQNLELGLADNYGGKARTMKGVLRSVSEVTVTMESGGKIQMIPREWVQSVTVDSARAKTKLETKVRVPVIRIRGKVGTAGKVYTIGLLAGLTWNPSYYLDISDPAKVKITMKATVQNLVADFEHIDLGMVSGFPEVSNLGSPDALTQGVSKIFELAQKYWRPPSAFPPAESGQTTGGGGYSGLQGGLGLVPSGIEKVAYDPSDTSLIVKGTEDAIRDLEQQVSGAQHNELFVYTASDISMKVLDRTYIVLQEVEAQYDYRYVVETQAAIGDASVIKSLVFKNATMQPWTDAPAMIVHEGQLIGQSAMPYTVIGDEAELRIGLATAVHASAESQETARRERAREVNSSVWDLVTMVDTVTVTNLDKAPVVVRVRRQVDGRVTKSSDGGAWTQLPAPNNSLNSVGKGQWEVELKPGQRRLLTVEYERFVQVR